MDKRVYLLMIVSFVVGMAELIIGGILDLVAGALHVSLTKAGWLITIFSIVFAISAPILLTLTQKIERKKLTLTSLFVFFLGSSVILFDASYEMLFVARILCAASGSLLVVLCVTMASQLVEETYRARAIGVIYMGISASLVLGIPIGLMLGNAFGWRAPFMMISVLTLFSMAGVALWMKPMAAKPPVPLRKQLQALRNVPLLLAQLTSFLFLTGHLALYAYLTPFLQEALNMSSRAVSITYFIFGVAAVFGGGIGGFLTDRFGTRRTILTLIALFGTALSLIPFTTFSTPLFLVVMVLWSMLSWAVTPAMQSYLIESAPEEADVQLSLNNSSLHFGIASGSFVGGLAIEQFGIMHNATIGGLIIFAALATVGLSMKWLSRQTNIA